MVPMREKREQRRYQAVSQFKVFDRSSKQPIGNLVNLSADGAMFVTPEPIAVSTVLECRVELPDNILGSDHATFDAVCVWCRKNDKKGWYESGYQLTRVSNKSVAIIGSLMHRFMIERPKPIEIG